MKRESDCQRDRRAQKIIGAVRVMSEYSGKKYETEEAVAIAIIKDLKIYLQDRYLVGRKA